MGGDSDDEAAETMQKLSKQQKKKVAAANKAPTKNADDGDAFKGAVGTGGGVGDFEAAPKRQPRGGDRPKTRDDKPRGERGEGRGGRGGRGRGGGERGGRGGKPQMHGTGFKDGARPRAGIKQDAEGNITRDGEKRERRPFTGKAREDGHPYDRQDGTGKARRVRKDRGENPEYKKKGEEGEEKKGEEEKPVEEKKEPKI